MKVKLIWVNLLLCLFIFFESYMIFQVWATPDEWEMPSGTALNSGSRKSLLTLVKKGEAQGCFTDVVKNNVFSVHRKEFIPAVKSDTPTDKDSAKQQRNSEPDPLVSNRIDLFGVIMVGDYSKALVKDASDREEPVKWVRQGDAVDKFVVKRIQKDRIVVSGSGKLHTVLLYDKKKHRKRLSGSPASLPARVANKGTKPPAAPVKKPPPTVNDNDKYEIIDTPFGKFKRKTQVIK